MLLLTDTQRAALSIQPVDGKGQPASIDGVPSWQSSDTAVAALVVATNGLSADVIAGIPGTAQISVTADADLGAGTANLTGVLDVQVVGGQAVALDIVAGVPQAQ